MYLKPSIHPDVTLDVIIPELLRVSKFCLINAKTSTNHTRVLRILQPFLWSVGVKLEFETCTFGFFHLQEVKSGNALEGVCVYTAGRGLGGCGGWGGSTGSKHYS